MNKHLDHNDINLYVHAIILNRVENLPDELKEHVEDCMICKERIIELQQILVSDREFMKKISLPPKLNHKKNNRKIVFYGVAASILLVVGLTVTLNIAYLSKDNGSVTYDITINKPQTNKEIPPYDKNRIIHAYSLQSNPFKKVNAIKKELADHGKRSSSNPK